MSFVLFIPECVNVYPNVFGEKHFGGHAKLINVTGEAVTLLSFLILSTPMKLTEGK